MKAHPPVAFTALVALLMLNPSKTLACERQCLEGFIDLYMEALAAQDYARLPVTRNVRFTENGQDLKLGQGLWVTVTGIGSYKFYMADPKTRQIGFFGTIREAGDPQVFFLRLKVQGQKISEIETLVARGAGLGNKPGALQLEERGLAAVMTQSVPVAERPSRKRMIEIANGYFDAMEQGTSAPAPFHERCTRIENGQQMAGNPDAVNPRGTGINMGALHCAQQFDTGFSRGFSFVPFRRFPLVDEERGLVLSVLALQHDGKLQEMRFTNGEVRAIPQLFRKPFQFTAAEVFKIVDGKIHQVEAVLIIVPYGMKSGWE